MDVLSTHTHTHTSSFFEILEYFAIIFFIYCNISVCETTLKHNKCQTTLQIASFSADGPLPKANTVSTFRKLQCVSQTDWL